MSRRRISPTAMGRTPPVGLGRATSPAPPSTGETQAGAGHEREAAQQRQAERGRPQCPPAHMHPLTVAPASRWAPVLCQKGKHEDSGSPSQGRCPGQREGHGVVGHWVAGSWDGALEGLGLWYHFRGKALWKVRQHTPFGQTLREPSWSPDSFLHLDWAV